MSDEEVATITLAGQPWVIPELAARQIKKIIPAIHVMQKLSSGSFDEADLTVLYGIAFVAITKARPDITLDAFDDMHITLAEITAAIPIIARQAGLEWRTAKPGEASAESQT